MVTSYLHKVLYVCEDFAEGCAQDASRQIKSVNYLNSVLPDTTREKQNKMSIRLFHTIMTT